MKRRTYSHLEALGRKPTEYDVVTSNLLYYVGRGFEVETPIGEWYRRYQQASPLVCARWDEFRDPRETTYAAYTARQRDREVYVDGLLHAIETTSLDGRLAPEGRQVIARLCGPLRFPFHGLQMIAAYVGSMAPSGRIAIVHALQAADEMRRVHRFAYRLRQLQLLQPELGTDARALWQTDPQWQPLRKLIERLLVTYDWGEAMIALAVVVRPVVEELWLAHAARLIATCGDEVTPKILQSLHDDGAWQRETTRAIVALVVADPTQRAVIEGWRDRWWPPALEVIEAASPLLGDVRPAVERTLAGYWTGLGLGGVA